MPADYSAFKVALDEASSSAKFNAFVQGLQDADNNLGDATKGSFAAGQIFDPAQIKQSGANTGDAIVWNGSAFAPGSASGIRFRKVTPKSVTTNVETDLLNGEITLPALSISQTVRFRFICETHQNASATPTARYRLKLGSTLIFDTNAQIADQSTSRFPFRVEGTIQNLGATNSQLAEGSLLGRYRAGGTPPTAAWAVGETLEFDGGIGNYARVEWVSRGLAIDTSGSQPLQLTVQWSVADANAETTLYLALVEVI